MAAESNNDLGKLFEISYLEALTILVKVNLETLLGNMILNMETPLITWKHYYQLGNIPINVETSFLT